MALNLRKLSFKAEGEILEVKLRDSNFTKILDEKVKINNKKEMMELAIKLKHKGVNFPSNWFD